MHRIPREESPSVAPASLGNHLAIGLVTLQMFTSLKNKTMEENINLKKADLRGWHRNTDLGCDLKTILSSDTSMQTGKEYQGVLRRDNDTIVDEYICKDAHYTFVETQPAAPEKRNPRVFNGEYITVTRRDDGSLRPNFKPVKTGRGFDVVRYAMAVSNELLWALDGLVEESE